MATSRRELLKAGVLGTLGFGPGDLLRLQAMAVDSGNVKKSPVKSVIVLQKYGVPSHIDLWDMKPNAPIEIRGAFQSIPAKIPGFRVCEHLPGYARHVHKKTIVRSMEHI